jgi:hypothetical protein
MVSWEREDSEHGAGELHDCVAAAMGDPRYRVGRAKVASDVQLAPTAA